MPQKSVPPVFPIPVVGWSIAPLPASNMVAVRFNFLSSPVAKEPHQTNYYGLTPGAARALIAELQRQIELVEIAAGNRAG